MRGRLTVAHPWLSMPAQQQHGIATAPPPLARALTLISTCLHSSSPAQQQHHRHWPALSPEPPLPLVQAHARGCLKDASLVLCHPLLQLLCAHTCEQTGLPLSPFSRMLTTAFWPFLRMPTTAFWPFLRLLTTAPSGAC